MGKIKEEIFNCNVIIVIVAVLAVTGIFFSMVGANESWESLFREIFIVLVSAIVTIWIAGKVAENAAIKGAIAGGEIAKFAAIEGAKEAARANLLWEQAKELAELYKMFWESTRAAQTILLHCQIKDPKTTPESLGESSRFFLEMQRKAGDLAIDEEERAFLVGVDYLTSSHVPKLFPEQTRGEYKEYFDEQPKIRDAILGIGTAGESGRICRKLKDKLGNLEKKNRDELMEMLEKSSVKN